jgi:hypothetical protein
LKNWLVAKKVWYNYDLSLNKLENWRSSKSIS